MKAKRFLSFVLSFLLVMSSISITAFADTEATGEEDISTDIPEGFELVNTVESDGEIWEFYAYSSGIEAYAETTATVSVYNQVDEPADVEVDGKYYEFVETVTSNNAIEDAATKIRDGGLILISEGTVVVNTVQTFGSKKNLTIKGAGVGKTTLTGNSSTFNNTTNGLGSSSLGSEYKALFRTTENDGIKFMDMTIDGGNCGVVKTLLGKAISHADFKVVRVNGNDAGTGTTYMENVTINGPLAHTTLIVGTTNTIGKLVAKNLTVNKPDDEVKFFGTALSGIAIDTNDGSVLELDGSYIDGMIIGSVAGLGKGYYKLEASTGVTVYTTIPKAIEICSGDSTELAKLVVKYCTNEDVATGASVAEAMVNDLTTITDGEATLLYGKNCEEMKALTVEFKAALDNIKDSVSGVDTAALYEKLNSALAISSWHTANADGNCENCGMEDVVVEEPTPELPPVKVEVSDSVEGDAEHKDDVVADVTSNEAVANVTTNIETDENAESIAAAKAELNVPDGAEVETTVSVKLTSFDIKDGKALKMSFDVNPQLVYNGQTAKLENLGTAVTFRLPVSSEATACRAIVYHEDERLGSYEIKEDGGYKYVELSSKTFSTYTVDAAVAEVDTLAELQAALSDDEINEIIITAMIVIPEGETVTIDLNGHNITAVVDPTDINSEKHIYVFGNQGNLTLKDSKDDGSVIARGIYNGYNNGVNAKLTIESGKYVGIDTDGGATIFNSATLVIDGGEIYGSRCAVDNAAATANTTINGGTFGGAYKETLSTSYIIRNDAGTLTINDANVVSGFGAVGCYGGTTIIENGKFLPTGWAGYTCHVVYVAGGADVTINDGKFKMNYFADAVPNSGSAVANYYSGKLVINGGEFHAHFDNVSPVELSSGSVINGGTYLVHSGTPSKHSYITKYLAEDVKLNENGEVVKDSVAEDYMEMDEFVAAVIAANGIYNGNNVTVKIIPGSGDAREAHSHNVPERLQKYGNPEVYYAQYQRFASLTDVSISNVNFVFVPAAVTVTDPWNTSGATTTENNINGELQFMNSGSVTLTSCTFDKIAVSLISASTVSVSDCEFTGLDAYAIKDISASGAVSITDTKFTDCNGGFWFSAAPASVTATGNTFTNIGRRGAIQFSSENDSNDNDNDDYTNTTINISGNTVTGGALLWQLNSTVSDGKVSEILENNTYETAYVDGSIEITYVAYIGEKGYTTLDAAIKAANAMTGDVTIEIYGKVEYTFSTPNLTGAYDKIIFVGKTEDAEISLTRNGEGGYIDGNGNDCAVEYYDLILSKPGGSYATNAGYMNQHYTTYQVGSVSYTNCTFPQGACAQKCPVSYTKCTFKDDVPADPKAYSLFVYADTTVTATGCTFEGERGVKMYSEAHTPTGNLIMTDCTFTESVTQKPAIVLTYGASVNIEGNTYPAKGTFELDLGGAPNGTLVSGSDAASAVCVNDNGACGVIVDGKIYTTVAQAAEVATEGSKVTLLHDSTETVEFKEGVVLDKNGFTADGVTVEETVVVAKIGDTPYATLQSAIDAVKDGETIILQSDCAEEVTFTQTKDVSFVLDGNNKNYTGNINITARAGKDAPSTLVIKNFKFSTTKSEYTFINSVETNYYPNNITIQNCSFKGTGASSDVSPIKLKSANNIEITDCTADSVHSLLQNTAGWNLTVENCTVTNAGRGMSLGSVQGVTVKNVKINALDTKYGIRLDAAYNNNAVFENCQISAFIPVVVRNASADSNLTFNGTNTMTAKNTDGIWCAIGTEEYEDNGKMPTAATGKVKVAVNDAGLDKSGIHGAYYEAQIGDVKYATLEEAVEAAEEGEVVTLLSNIIATEIIDITKSITLDMNTKTISSTGTVYRPLKIAGNNSDIAVTIKNGAIAVSDITYKADQSSALLVYDGADVTLENVKISGSNYAVMLAGYYGYSNGVAKNNTTSLYVNSGAELVAGNAAIIGQGSYPNTYIEINEGAKVTSTDSIAIYHPQKGELVVNGGEITGATAIYLKAGELTVNGGTISANGEATDYEFVESGANVTGDAIVVESCNYGGYGAPVVDIKGGVITSEDAKAVASYADEGYDVVKEFISGGSFSSDVSELCAKGFTVEVNEDGTYGVVPPVTISTADELIAFAIDVNENGNTYEGKYVVLANDIDLAGSETNLWTPIGKSGDSNPKFKGTFDGQGNIIKNLYVKQGAAYHAAGLFGATNGTIKNFTIDGAYVESLSSGSATVNGTAVVAGSTAYGATIDNVHVKNATVKGNRYVAGIVGYMDGTVTNCSVENVTLVATPDDIDGNGVYDNGDKVGGIVGYTNCHETVTPHIVSNCELKGEVNITGYRDMGGLVGTVQSNVVVGENVNNAKVTITVDQVTYFYEKKDANANEFIGRGTASATSPENTRGEEATFETVIVEPVVAEINGEGYASLEEALEAASDGDTIIILGDVTESITSICDVKLTTNVAEGVTITNTYSDDYVDFNNVVIGAGVTLNIPKVFSSGNDSVNVIEGTLNVGATYYHSSNAKTTIQNGGKVTTVGMTVVRYNSDPDAGIYIYGDNNAETVEFSCDNTIGAYSGTFYAKDAVVEANMLWLDYKKDSSEESDEYPEINASFDNSILRVTSELRLYKDATLTLEETSVTAGKVQVRQDATPVVTMDSTSSIKASSVENLSGATINAVLGEDGTVTFKTFVAQIGEAYYFTLEDAAKDIATDGSDTTIKLLCDIEIPDSISFKYGEGDIIFTADTPVVVKQTAAGKDFDFTVGEENKIIIGENVTFEIYDNAGGFYVYYGPSVEIKGAITGGQNWGVVYLYNGTHTVTETGKLGTGRIQMGYSEATVKGTVDTNYLLVEGSTFTADGAVVDANVIYDNNNGGQRWGASVFNIKNGSEVNTSALTLSYEDTVFNMDLSSRLTAGKVTGSGKIIIDATSFDGSDVQVIAADMSEFTGAVEVTGNDEAKYEITSTGLVITSVYGVLNTKTGYLRNLIGNFNDENKTEGYRVFLFAGIDSLNYANVGYEVKFNGVEKSATSKTVYASCKVNEKTYYPTAFGDDSKYIIAQGVMFGKSYAAESFEYRVFATKHDGHKIYTPWKTVDGIYTLQTN